MTKEELEKEAEVFAKYYESLFPNEFEIFYKAFLKVAEPREKRIEELEEAKANFEYLLEGRDNEIDELKVQIKVLEQNLEDTEICENGWKNRVKELEAQIEKMNEKTVSLCEGCVRLPMLYK